MLPHYGTEMLSRLDFSVLLVRTIGMNHQLARGTMHKPWTTPLPSLTPLPAAPILIAHPAADVWPRALLGRGAVSDERQGQDALRPLQQAI